MNQTNRNIESANKELTSDLQRIASMMKSLSPSLKEVAGEVTQMEDLSRDILNYINSPGIGLQHNISRVDHAVALLGQRRTLAIIERRLIAAERKQAQLEKNNSITNQ